VIVAGPPGAGKSTMCAGLARYYELMHRPSILVNLDPACEEYLTPFSIDVRNFIHVDTVMREHKLGPNGALVYCVQVLRSSNWLLNRLAGFGDGDKYPFIIFDLPGQTELWTHSDDMRKILDSFVEAFDARLVVAHLIDSNQCTRPATYVAAALVALQAMLRLQLPHVNVLSKIDQLPRFESAMPFHITYFTQSSNLTRLVPYCQPGDAQSVFDPDDPMYNQTKSKKKLSGVQRLTAKICELIDDFSLLAFQPLDISDGESVANLVTLLDKAIGYPTYGPVQLIQDATEIFLGQEQTPSSAFQEGGAGHVQDKDPISVAHLRGGKNEADREAMRRWFKR